MKEGKITDRDHVFIDRYCTHFKAHRAAIEAGYAESVAKSWAYVWVSNAKEKPLVYAEIQRRLAEKRSKNRATQERVLQELERLAFANVRDYYEEPKLKKNRKRKAAATLKPIHDLDDDLAAAVSEVSFDSRGKPKIKLHDKNPALEKLCKHLGLFEKDNRQKTDLTLTIRGILDDIDGQSAGLPTT